MTKLLATLATAALIVALAFAGLSAWLADPVRQETERAKAAQALVEQRQAALSWTAFTGAIGPIVAGSISLLAVCVAVGAGAVALARGLEAMDRRQALKGRLQPVAGQVSISVANADQAALMGTAGYWQAQIETAKKPVFSGAARSERLTIGAPAQPAALPNRPAVELPAPAAPLMLPGVVSLANVLTWKPTLDRILIGLDPHGQPWTVTAKDLVHVALVGSTGAGKSNSLRLITSQLLAAGARVVLADPHYSPKDADDDLTGDWRPIEQRLYRPVAVLPAELVSLFDWLGEELTNRLARRRAGEHSGPPLFVAMDETPVIFGKAEDAADVLTSILREGRKVGMYAITSTQDMLTRTLGPGGAVRDQFRTAIYGGGDIHSASVLLDLPRRQIDDAGLGKGTVLLRSAATPQAGLARLPLVLDSDLHKLLPMPQASNQRPFTDFATSSPGSGGSGAEVAEVGGSGNVIVFPTPKIERREVAEVAEVADDEREARAIELMRGTADTPPMSMTSAVATVYGVKGGREFQRIANRLRARMLGSMDDQDQAAAEGD